MGSTAYNIAIKNEATSDIVDISGSLNIINIEKINDDLIQKLKFTNNLQVNISNVDSIDITFIQLLLALKKEYFNHGLKSVINMDMPDDLWLLINNAGYNKQIFN